jgi:hypothetical protein
MKLEAEGLFEKLLGADIDTVSAVKTRFEAYIMDRHQQLTYDQKQLAANAYEKLEQALVMLNLLKDKLS